MYVYSYGLVLWKKEREIQILTERERERMEKRKGRKIRGNEIDRERKKE